MKDDFEHSRGRGVSTEIWIAAAPQRLFFKDEFLQSACPPFGTKQTFGPEDFCDAKRRFSSIPQIANPPPPDDGRGHINGRFRELPAPLGWLAAPVPAVFVPRESD